MLPLRIAVATRCFDQPFKPALQAAGSIGVQGVQIDVRNELKPSEMTDTGRRQFLHYLDEISLQVAALRLPTRRSFCDADQLEARIAATKTAMQFAYDLKASILTVRIGRVPEDAESPEFRVLCEVLNDIARHGNHVGTTLAVTPSGDTPQALDRLLDQVTLGPIGIHYDPAVFVMSGQSPLDALRALHHRIVHVQVRDAVRDVDGSGLEVPVGRGEVGWEECLALLEEAAYRGWLTIDRTAGDNRAIDAAHAVEYLTQVAGR